MLWGEISINLGPKELMITFLVQPVLQGRTAHPRILLAPVWRVQLTLSQMELLLQVAPALQDITELHRIVQRTDVIVSQDNHFS